MHWVPLRSFMSTWVRTIARTTLKTSTSTSTLATVATVAAVVGGTETSYWICLSLLCQYIFCNLEESIQIYYYSTHTHTLLYLLHLLLLRVIQIS